MNCCKCGGEILNIPDCLEGCCDTICQGCSGEHDNSAIKDPPMQSMVLENAFRGAGPVLARVLA